MPQSAGDFEGGSLNFLKFILVKNTKPNVDSGGTTINHPMEFIREIDEDH